VVVPGPVPSSRGGAKRGESWSRSASNERDHGSLYNTQLIFDAADGSFSNAARSHRPSMSG